MDPKSEVQVEVPKSTLNEALQKLKSYNNIQYFTEGALIDAMDNNNSWRVARITQIKNEFAFLSYDGWSSKWDETHKLNSGRLAPFRKYTPPYTGPLKNTNRTIDLKEFLNLIKKNMHHMDQITSVNFLSDPHVINQTVRGEIFILIDAILNFSFANDVSEHIKTFIEFFERFIKFFVDYLSILPTLIKDYVDGKALNLMLNLVHDKIAAASCFPELFSSIAKLFGVEGRCLKFYQQNEFTINPCTKAFVTKPKDRHTSSHTQIVNFVNQFGNLGGFDRLLDLMKWEHIPETKKPNDPIDNENIYKFPLNIIKHILIIIDPIINMMSTSFKESFLNEFKKLFFMRIDNISIKEIKDLDPSVAFGLLNQIQPILDEICVKETFMLTEEAELNLSLKLLKSPFLQKKIRGITHFKECIERTDTSSSSEYKAEPKKKMKYYTTESLRKYFIQNNLLDIILGENFHVEVFKRSQPIFKFFATSGGFTTEQLNALWKAVEFKHEGYTTAIYDLIIELLKSLSLESLEFLFTKIINTPQEKCDDALIRLMMEFSVIAMSNLNSATNMASYSTFLSSSKTKKNLQNPKNEFFALKYLWDLAQDNSKLDVKYIDQCLNAIQNLMKSSYFKPEREKYLNLCFESVKQGVSVPQSLNIALFILSTYSTYQMFSRESLEDTLNKYNKEYNLNEMVITDCEEYLKIVSKIDEKNKQKALKIDSAQYIFTGKFNHHDSIQHRLSFIHSIDPFVEKKFQLNIDQIKRLWMIMIKKSVTPVEQSIFLSWLTRSKESSNSSSSKKSFNLNENILKNILLNIISDKVLMEDYVTLTPEIYNCIQTLFEIVNINEDCLESNNGKSLKRMSKYEGIHGMEYFWSILIKASNEIVQKTCRNFLINIHLKFGNNVSTEQRLKIWQNFINKCLDYLNNNANVPLIISLVKGFFENIQGTKYLPPKEPGNIPMMSVPVQIKAISDEITSKKIITLPNNSTFLCLRLQINEDFSLKNADFDLVMGPNYNIRLTAENEEEYAIFVLDNLKDKTVTAALNKGSRDNQAKDKFKLQMANNAKFTDTLFELLSSSNVTLVEEVWQILTSLPLNKNLRTQIEKLSNIDGTEENWNKLLDYSCYRKFMYCLEIIDDILEADVNDEWSVKFCKKKGFNHLLRIYDQITEEKIYNSFNLKCFGLLAKILTSFITKNFGVVSSEKTIQNIVSKAMFLIYEALNFIVNSPLANKSDICEEDNYMPEEFMENNFDLILCLFMKNRNIISIFYKFKELSQLFKYALLECNDAKIRKIFQNGVLSFIEENKKPLLELQDLPSPQMFFLTHLITEFRENDNFLSYRTKCNNYFELIYAIFHKIPREEIKETVKHINLFELQTYLIKEFLQIPIFEKIQTDNDYYLQGLLKLFDCVIYANPDTRAQLLAHSDFLIYLFDTCLFEKPTGLEPSNTILPPKCKSPESRKAAFGLLNMLISEETAHPKILEILEKIKKLLGNAYWRTNSSNDWNISSIYMEKSITGYVGLKNLGCTCYMNSLLQQFFMIPEFREAILAIPAKSNSNVEDSESLLYQFQLILAALQNSHKQYYDPRGFCHANKDFEGKPVNVLEQMDVDEFFNHFLDKLETQIKHSKNAEIIKKIFGGTLSNELICKGCPHYSEREEIFLALGLQVKNKKSIAESLDSFIQGEMLEGENAYFCDKCDKKIPTLKRTCIKKLPNMLILVLKRFEFDFDKMIKIKLNDLCEFPRKLNMMQYTQNFLKKKEKDKNGDELDNDSDNGNNANNTTTAEDEYPPEYYDYTLKGVVIHIGTADSGHYYSLISESRDKSSSSEDKWLEFNDIHVRKFDINDLASEAFGGDEKNLANSIMMSNLTKSMKERSKNAYLLFYERVKNFDENGNELSQLSIPENNEVSPKLFNEIKEDNVKYYINKNCFDVEFSMFIQRIMAKTIENHRFSDPISLDLYKLCLLYFFAVVVRYKDREKSIPIMMKFLKKALNNSVDLANWFLIHASSEEIMKETLIECPIKDIKYIISGLYIEALKKVMDEKKDSAIRTLEMCLNLLIECKERKVMDVFYRIFIVFSKFSKSYKNLLLEKKFIPLMFYYINEQTIPSELSYQKPQPLEFNEMGGTMRDKKGIAIRSIEEIVEKKKEKALLESISINYSNLIIALSNLLCSIPLLDTPSTKTSKISLILEPTVEYKLDSDEKKFIYNPLFWKKIWSESISKTTWKPVAKLFAYLCMNNKQVTMEVLKAGLDELNSSDENTKVYLKIFEILMLVDDEYKSSRAKHIVDKLMSVFKENLKYYKFSNTMLDYFFKMCGRSGYILKVFSEYLSENKQMYRVIEEWIKSLRDLGYHLNSQNITIYKRRKANYNSNMLQINNSKLIKKLQEKLIKVNKIYKEEREGLLADYDSDEDYLDPPPKINDKFDITMDNGNVVSGTVSDTFDDMICLKIQNLTRWIPYDYERIGPYGKMHEYYEDSLDFYK